jgi:hypothetical protein
LENLGEKVAEDKPNTAIESHLILEEKATHVFAEDPLANTQDNHFDLKRLLENRINELPEKHYDSQVQSFGGVGSGTNFDACIDVNFLGH